MLFHFLGQDLFSKDFFTKENDHYLLLIARVQVWLLGCWSLFQGLSITFNALKALGHFLKQSTNCVFVLEEYPSVLLAYFEMQTTQKAFTIFSSCCWFNGSPRLWAFCKFAMLWSLQFLFTLWRILHNPCALSGEVSLANRLCAWCCTWQKHYWLLRNHQRLFDRKRVGIMEWHL